MMSETKVETKRVKGNRVGYIVIQKCPTGWEPRRPDRDGRMMVYNTEEAAINSYNDIYPDGGQAYDILSGAGLARVVPVYVEVT